MWLPDQTFRTIVSSTPLVSIDLVLQDLRGGVLLGQRVNRPAQGDWFVPGGRIQKDESLDMAFRRITSNELGVAFERDQAAFLGVYEHFYSDGVFGAGDTDPTTHYVVLAYHLRMSGDIPLSPSIDQHRAYRWFPVTAVQTDVDIHPNSRAYLSALS